MTSDDGSPVLLASGVRKSFAGGSARGPVRPVLDGVDLAVARGEVVAVAGRSGSGKTTLLTILTGWLAPDEGSVTLAGEAIGPHRAWQELALLPQSLGLLEELTVAENVGLPKRLAPGERGTGTGADALLADLGLAHLAERYPSEVSLGEQQRTALARAAAIRPWVLIADEPISHQNREWAEAMLGVIRQLAADGMACVLATHDELAFAAADRVLDLLDGRLHGRVLDE